RALPRDGSRQRRRAAPRAEDRRPLTRPGRRAARHALREAAPSPAPDSRAALSDRAWLLAGPLALVMLLLACRGAPLGVPVADDYTFLYTLRFQHPLDLFSPMGSPL